VDPDYCWLAVGASALGIAFLSLNLGALRNYSLARFEELDLGANQLARVKRIVEREEHLILSATVVRGLLMIGGVVALSAALVAETLLSARPGPGLPIPYWRWLLTGGEALAIGAGVFLALGRIVPQALGEGRAEAVLLRLVPILVWISLCSRPLTWLFGGLSTVALRVFNVREIDDKEDARDEILSAALAGESEGVIDQATKDVIENLMEFREADVSEVMTPRIDIVAVDSSMSLEEMLEVALEHERSRLPVTEGGLDKIVGVLMVKDLLRAMRDPDLSPQDLFRKPFFVPETKQIADLLKELRQRKVHMAIVADEYGGTAGLATIEDLIEEIIGEIDDEHDKEVVPAVRRLSEGLVDADAKLHIDEFNETFGTRLPEDVDVETLGGFIALELGRIPAQGDRVEHGGTSFEVTAADERRVTRVLVKLAKKAG
jgi:magnesium and cobalt exporter, CNNM family